MPAEALAHASAAVGQKSLLEQAWDVFLDIIFLNVIFMDIILGTSFYGHRFIDIMHGGVALSICPGVL